MDLVRFGTNLAAIGLITVVGRSGETAVTHLGIWSGEIAIIGKLQALAGWPDLRNAPHQISDRHLGRHRLMMVPDEVEVTEVEATNMWLDWVESW